MSNQTQKNIREILDHSSAQTPRKAATVAFTDFVHGLIISTPFSLNDFTFLSIGPEEFCIIDLTVFGEPELASTWLTIGIGLKPTGLYVKLPKITTRCSLSVVNNLARTAHTQLRIEWYDKDGNIIGSKEFGASTGNTLPPHQIFTYVISTPGVMMIAAYSNTETPLCRLQVE